MLRRAKRLTPTPTQRDSKQNQSAGAGPGEWGAAGAAHVPLLGRQVRGVEPEHERVAPRGHLLPEAGERRALVAADPAGLDGRAPQIGARRRQGRGQRTLLRMGRAQAAVPARW